ncbi:MAG: hypothetical protein HXX17_16570 [Geobacteraceae bacterium]|nr:hypothetical protein [Geobacteraceae bacterium]
MKCPKCSSRLIAAPEYGTGGVRCLCGWLKLGVLPTVMKVIPSKLASTVKLQATLKQRQEVNHA